MSLYRHVRGQERTLLNEVVDRNAGRGARNPGVDKVGSIPGAWVMATVDTFRRFLIEQGALP